MYQGKEVICPHLKGSTEGVQCGVVDTLIRSIEDADIRLCMSRHHEACSYYVFFLRRTITEAVEPDTALGTL